MMLTTIAITWALYFTGWTQHTLTMQKMIYLSLGLVVIQALIQVVKERITKYEIKSGLNGKKTDEQIVEMLKLIYKKL
jgi:hypothetical protein